MPKLSNKNRLSLVFPELVKEWHPTKNEELTPNGVSYGSHHKVLWICEKGHEWPAIINDRTSGNGCPYCSGKLVCNDNCLATLRPDIAAQWHPTKNGDLTPNDFTCNSNKKVWWLCDKCKEFWPAFIYSRCRSNSKNKGCPYCIGKKVCKDNCLATLFPELAAQWHPTLNKDLTPNDFTYGSTEVVWWVCEKGHEWSSTINNRTKPSTNGCPFCGGKLVCEDNCLATVNPELAAQWHPTLNGDLTPFTFTCNSNKKVWWLCDKCGNEWKISINNRQSGKGCKYCSKGPVSGISQKWLDSLNILKKYREIFLPDLNYTVDAFVPETNTVYEFFGDYWHGNPEKYSTAEKNFHNGKTFGELYEETKTRIFRLEGAGYKVIYIWESDYIKNKK